MRSKEFDEANMVIGGEGLKGIPAYRDPKHGKITACFELTQEEIDRIYATGEIYIRFNTGGLPFFPAITTSCLKERLIMQSRVRAEREAQANLPEEDE